MAVSALFNRKQQLDAPYTAPQSFDDGDAAPIPNLEGGGEGELPIIPGGLGGGVGDTGGGGGPIDPPPPPIDAGGGDLPIDPPPLYGDDPIEPPAKHPTDGLLPGDGLPGELGPPTDGGGGPKGPADLKGSIYAKLLELINRDPSKSPASAAYRTSQQRQQERDRALLAERASAEGYGTDSGAFDTDLLGLNQVRGENEANFDANQTNQQEQMILQALGLGGNLYGNDLNRDLNASQFEQLQNSGLLQLILQQLSQQGQGAV